MSKLFFSILILITSFSNVDAQEKVTSVESQKLVKEVCDLMFGDKGVEFLQIALVKYIPPKDLAVFKEKNPEYIINMAGGAFYEIVKNDGENVEVYVKTLYAQNWEEKYFFKVIKINGKIYFQPKFRPGWIDLWTFHGDL
jgi:hypothetical protein